LPTLVSFQEVWETEALANIVTFECILHRINGDDAYVSLVNSSGVELVRRLLASYLMAHGIGVDDEFTLEVEFFAAEPVVRLIPKPPLVLSDGEVCAILNQARIVALELMED
jgi:hypothetical protein